MTDTSRPPYEEAPALKRFTMHVRHGFFGRVGGVSTGVYRSLNCGPGSGDGASCNCGLENQATGTTCTDAIDNDGDGATDTSIESALPW